MTANNPPRSPSIQICLESELCLEPGYIAIPTPKTPRQDNRIKSCSDDNITIDQYLDLVSQNEKLFRKDHTKVRNMAIAFAYKN